MLLKSSKNNFTKKVPNIREITRSVPHMAMVATYKYFQSKITRKCTKFKEKVNC